MKFNAGLLRKMMHEETYDFCELNFVSSDGWRQTGGYQYGKKEYIFEYRNKFYIVKDIRRKDCEYHSPYRYESSTWVGDIECQEVELRDVTEQEWIRV